MKASLIAVVTVALTAPLAAQWLNQPTVGIPRTSDGKPNLAAPTPRTPDGKPDLSGLWNKISPKYSRNIAADLKPEEIQPWARTLVDERREDLGKDYMNVQCVPLGPGYATSADSTGFDPTDEGAAYGRGVPRLRGLRAVAGRGRALRARVITNPAPCVEGSPGSGDTV
jgi:hypothetical protein